MPDKLSEGDRSSLMARVRSTSNKSTEAIVEVALIDAGMSGWEKQPKGILGKPDFYFPDYRLVIFVDGCFWHACPKCRRPMPVARAEYWREKIDRNRRRDNRNRRKLRQDGYHVMRIWEHEVTKKNWMQRLKALLHRIDASGRA